ncbi:Signal transduction histidine kinase [Pedobacter steynii]|uniref:histidine kinase n=1 Tax=Pedobacter steynii TaxID=430522 RepID=A0A1G9ZAP9_9SPHI|nr:HAMP domain-containing sensor histidine kinase [Pedobacter steynii]NQX40005.1 HAMP domain-containing histidine kinase [Pedobacter steynii]SDN18490.1 Signal transduction histidine kinase [Pedobacter steynii]
MLKRVVLFFLFTVIFLLNPGKGFSQIAELSKLESGLPLIKDSISYVNALNRIAMLSHLRYRDSCLYYARKAKQISLRLNYRKGIADAKNCEAIYYVSLNNYLSAKYFNDALQIYRSIDDQENVCQVLMNIGVLISMNKDDGRSLEYLHQAFEKSKSLKNDSIRSIVISNLLDLDTTLTPERYHSLSEEGMQIAKKYKDDRMILYYDVSTGQRLYQQGEKEKGKAILLRSLHKADSLGLENVKVWIYAPLSDMMMDEGKHDLGMDYLKRGLEESGKFGYADFYLIFAEKLYQHYKQHNEPEKAYYYISLLLSKQNSIAEAADKSGYNYLNYALRENENEELKGKVGSRRKTIALLGSLFVVSVALLFFVYRSLMSKRQHVKVQQKLHDVTLQQNAALQKTNHFNTMLISVIAHDVRQPFSTIVMLANVFNDDVDLLSEEEKLGIMKELSETSQKSLSFMDGLLEWIKSKKTGFEYQPEELQLNGLIIEANTFFRIAQEKKNIKLTVNIPEQTRVLTHKQMLLFILRNILNNATKFSPLGGTITIDSSIENGNIVISIRDQGAGMSQKQIDQLFTAGSGDLEQNENNGAGLALSISYEMAMIMNARISLDSELEKGTIFYISLKNVK